MSQVLTAVFEDGVLKPQSALNLASGVKVQIVVSPCVDIEAPRLADFEELERYRAQHPIHSNGKRLTRDQLHERR